MRSKWSSSLRFRLLALGLMPLLVAFPIVIAALLLVGGERANNLLVSNLRSNLAGARSYLEQVKADAGVRVGEMVKSERLVRLVHSKAGRHELDEALATAARGGGLDFLMIAGADGRIIGSSTGVSAEARLPDSYVIRQARIGVANAAYERFTNQQLASLSPRFPAEASIAIAAGENTPAAQEMDGLMINAAAHFPLAINDEDAILLGGILLNGNFALIEHLREILFPIGSLPGDAEGMTSIHLDAATIAVSRQRQQGQRVLGVRPPVDVVQTVMQQGQPWFGHLEFGGSSYMMGYEPINDGNGQRIGMIGAGHPDAPYLKTVLLIMGMIAGLLAITMLAISVLFLRTGRELTQRLARISETMTRVGRGEREARVGTAERGDELGRLARHFDQLLDTIEMQDQMRRASLKTIADEASRRRALFEHERDGVVIIDADGNIFEANPKAATMLGYDIEEFRRLKIRDWNAQFTPAEIEEILARTGSEGQFFETIHRRKDGSTYPAEVSISRAQWGSETYWLILLRDISERKAAEAELEAYRSNLERLVSERTLELHSRTEQLDAIFGLSPDGFVSFDADRRVTFANNAFLRMTGLVADEIVNLDETAFSQLLAGKCIETAPFHGIAALRAERLKNAAGHEHNRRQLIELAGPGNRVLEVGIRLSDAANVSQVLYFRDITHETEVDRMKSEFLTTAAHELRTPMASIYGYSELMMAQEFDAEMRKELLDTIHRQSELMISIINELLDLARIEARRGKDFMLERLPLQEILEAVVSGYKPPPDRDAPEVAPLEVPLFVKVDRKKIQQALLNILSNAYKYSRPGSVVRVSCRQELQGDKPQIGIEVRDQGIGMTPEQLERVCERFYRADASGKFPGTGLGMSIVKEIVELHGGELAIESQLGVGSAVTLWIPAA